eukprot:SM001470S01085  [mRNA]  locus=s1470:6:1985:+ [translate_table: standard]
MVADAAADFAAALGRGTAVAEFAAFAARYGRSYASADEIRRRFAAFAANKRLIDAANAAGLPYTLAINEFADVTWDEFRRTALGALQNCSATEGTHIDAAAGRALPAEMDWRAAGIVSPVKNQGRCGSCWTFSTTGAVEAAFAQAHGGAAVSLSEQQLVDCAEAYNNHGCDGGLPSQAFEYIRYNGGIDTEAAYPYKADDEKCAYNASTIGARISGVVNITEYAEDELMDVVAFVRPVSIAFEVAPDFRFYNGGVYSSLTCRSGPDTVNHAVLAVGFGVDAATDMQYWIVKNSWGTAWGVDGYFWIERGKNMCGK